jgi:hypothetical protein
MKTLIVQYLDLPTRWSFSLTNVKNFAAHDDPQMDGLKFVVEAAKHGYSSLVEVIIEEWQVAQQYNLLPYLLEIFAFPTPQSFLVFLRQGRKLQFDMWNFSTNFAKAFSTWIEMCEDAQHVALSSSLLLEIEKFGRGLIYVISGELLRDSLTGLTFVRRIIDHEHEKNTSVWIHAFKRWPMGRIIIQKKSSWRSFPDRSMPSLKHCKKEYFCQEERKY